MPRFPTLLAGVCAGAFASPWLQDPVKPPPATPPPATAPATTPPAKEALAQELPGRSAPHPLQGVYTLRARVTEGRREGNPARGYLAITQRHLFLCLAAPGPDASRPLVRAGVRSWKPQEEFVNATIQLGWYSDKDGGMHSERPGTEERRRIELVLGGVRVLQDEKNWLEFDRLE